MKINFNSKIRLVLCMALFFQLTLEPQAEAHLWQKPQRPLKVALAPQRFGTIRDVVPSKKDPPQFTLIHIQDIHMNKEAQHNISRAIQTLVNQKTVDLVALEGAFEKFDFSAFQSFPYPPSVFFVADQLLNQNKITGPIHAALSQSQVSLPPFVGVDHHGHYKKNVAAYKKASRQAPALMEALARKEKTLESLKDDVFGNELRFFDTQVNAYHNRTLPLGDYARLLGTGLSTHQIRLFLAALSLENQLDMKQVERQRSLLLSSLLKRLSKKEHPYLLRTVSRYQASQISHAQFYGTLKKFCYQKNVPLSRYRAMDSYIRYILLADQIQAARLFEEFKRQEKDQYQALARSDQQKDLIRQSREIRLIKKLVQFSLTPSEWEEARPLSMAPWDLSSFKDFYLQAQARDREMVQNLKTAIKKNKARVVVLVAGGFHSSGIQSELKKENIRLVSFVPKVSQIETDQGTKYLGVFTQEKSPLEEIFEGDQLFLTFPPFSRGVQNESALKIGGDSLYKNKVSPAHFKSWLRFFWGWTDLRIHLTRSGKIRVAGRFKRHSSDNPYLQIDVSPDLTLSLANESQLTLPFWTAFFTFLLLIVSAGDVKKATRWARKLTASEFFAIYLVPALELVALPGLMIVLATMMSPVLALLLSSFLFAVAHDVDRLSIWLYAKVRGRAPPESLLSIADRIVMRFRGSLEINALAYLPFDLFYSQSFTFSSLFSLVHWPLLLSSALLAYGRHALWNRTVAKTYRLMACPPPPSGGPARTLFRTFEGLIEYVVSPENEVGIDLASYATNHGKHGVYYALQALDEKGFQIHPPRAHQEMGIHSPTRTNIRKAHDILNHHLSNRGLFKRVNLRSEIFFSALEKIQANRDRYKELDGQFRLAKELVEGFSLDALAMGDLYNVFCSDQGRKALGQDLKWKSINFPYFRLVKTAREIKRRLDDPTPDTDPRGVLGMLRIAKWLNDEKKEKTNLAHLYSAFGGDGKYRSAVKILLEEDAEEDNLGWEMIVLPYDRLVNTADEIKRRLDDPTPATDPRGVLGMLRIAKWLNDEKQEKTNLGSLYSAFGGDGKYQSAVKILLGKDVEEIDLGWEWINLPYDRLVDTAREIKKRLGRPRPATDPRGVLGMLRIAKWLKDKKKEKTNLGQLYSAFGGDGKYQSAVKILLEEEGEENDLGWEYINLPYDRLVDTAREIKKRLARPKPTTDPRGVLGMLRIAKWLNDEKKEKTHLGHLYSAFGGDGKYQSAVKILLGKDVKEVDLGWEIITLPYDRLVETADEIKRRLENLTPETDPRGVLGMLRIAKWLNDEKKEKTNLGQLYSAFGGDGKYQSAVKILLGKDVEEIDLGWEYINLPYDRLVETADEIKRRLDNSTPDTDPRGVLGMLRIAKWLKDEKKEKTNLGQLYSAFGGEGKYQSAVKILLGKDAEEIDLGWEYINLPYDRLVETADEIKRRLESLTPATDPRGVLGMFRIAKWLKDEKKEKTHLSHVYSAFGGEGKYRAVVKILLEEDVEEVDLGWEWINLPYDRLVETADEIKHRLYNPTPETDPRGVLGMLRIAKWLNDEKKEKTHLISLYSAFGGEGKYQSVVKILLGKDAEEVDLGWEYINLPYDRLVETADEIKRRLESLTPATDPRGVLGMFRIAKWLNDEKKEKTNLGHLHSAFGGEGKYRAVVKILLGKDVEEVDLGWEYMNFPYDRLVETADEIKHRLDNLTPATDPRGVLGMLRIAKWLKDEKKEKTHLSQLHRAFIREHKFGAAAAILLNEPVPEREFNWPRIDHPHDRFIQAVQNFVGSRRVGYSDDELSVLGTGLQGENLVEEAIEAFPDLWTRARPAILEEAERLKGEPEPASQADLVLPLWGSVLTVLFVVFLFETFGKAYQRARRTTNTRIFVVYLVPALELVALPGLMIVLATMMSPVLALLLSSFLFAVAHDVDRLSIWLYAKVRGRAPPESLLTIADRIVTRFRGSLEITALAYLPFDLFYSQSFTFSSLFSLIHWPLLLSSALLAYGRHALWNRTVAKEYRLMADTSPSAGPAQTLFGTFDDLIEYVVNPEHKVGIDLASYATNHGKHGVYYALEALDKKGFQIRPPKSRPGTGIHSPSRTNIQKAHSILNHHLRKRSLFKGVQLKPEIFFSGLKKVQESGHSYTGLDGQFRLAKELVEELGLDALGMGNLYDVFCSNHGRQALGHDLQWKKIDLPYDRLVDTAREIKKRLVESRPATDPRGVLGMLRIAKWLKEGKEKTNLGHLYSAFGGEGKVQSAVKILLEEEIELDEDDLGWEKIDLPYDRLVDTAQEIKGRLESPNPNTDPRGVLGMLRIAKWLREDKEEKVHLNHLYTAFGGKGKYQAVVKILLGEDVEEDDLGWKAISLPYDRLVETAQEIKNRLASPAPETDPRGVLGMLRIAKWLKRKGEKTNLAHLYTAFGGKGKYRSVVKILLGEDVEEDDLGWEKLGLPYDRLVETAREIKKRLVRPRPATDPRGVLGMLRIAKWLKERDQKTHLEHLYATFGGEGKYRSAVRILLGKDVEEVDLGWEKISLPYDRLVETAQEIKDRLETPNPITDPRGVLGLLRIAKWLKNRGEKTFLSDLYSAFMGEHKFGAAATILLNESVVENEFNWPRIEHPYDRFIQAVQNFVDSDPVGYSGGDLSVLGAGLQGENLVEEAIEAFPDLWTRARLAILEEAERLKGEPEPASQADLVLPLWGSVLTVLFVVFLFETFGKAYQRARRTTNTRIFVVYLVPALELVALPGLMIVLATMMSPVLALLLSSFLFAVAHDVDRLSIWLYAKVRGRAPPESLLSIADRIVTRFRGSLEINALAYLPFDLFYSQSFTFSSLFSLIHWPLLLSSALLAYGRHALWNRTVGKEYRLMADTPSSEEPSQTLFDSFDDLIEYVVNPENEVGIDLASYATNHGKHGVYYALQALDEKGFQIRPPKSRPGTGIHSPTRTNIRKAHDILNHNLSNRGLFKRVDLRSEIFFSALEKIRANNDRYKELDGQFRLAKELVQEFSLDALAMGDLYNVFCSDQGRKALGQDLKWKSINFPYFRLVKTAREIKDRLDNPELATDPRGVLGMLRVAKWLNDEKQEKTNLAHLYSAFGGDGKYRSAVKILLEEDVEEVDLGWEYMNLPYDRLVETADEIKHRLDNPTPDTNPRGVLGMLRIAKWLKDEKEEKTHLGQLYSAFGGDGKYQSAVKILLGKDVKEVDLGWEWISLPYDRLVETADEIKHRLDNSTPETDPRGVLGMLRIAKWLNDEKEEKTHLGHLYSAFGGDGKYQSAVKILLGKDVKEVDLGWEWINLPYGRLVETADEIKRRLDNPTPETDPRGVLGMLRIAKWLKDEKKEKTHLSHLYSAFGGDGKYRAVVKILLEEDVEEVDLGWEKIVLPYDRLVETADEIKHRLDNLEPATDPCGVLGMFRIAKWLKDEKKEKTNLGQLYSAFGGDGKYQAIVKILLEEDVEEVDLGWEYINLPYDRLVETADEIKHRLDNLEPATDPCGVLGMLRIAKWLKDEKKEKTNLGQLYSAFGGEGKYQSAVKILLGKDVKEDNLGWEMIVLPYDRLVETADEIKRRLENLTPTTDPRGVLGMLRIAKWLNDEKKEKTNLGQLYSAFGGEGKYQSAVKILLGKDVKEDNLGWEMIVLPYDRLVETADEIKRRLDNSTPETDPRGVLGMLRIAKWLKDEKKEKTNLSQLYSAFGGDGKYRAVVKILLEEDVEEVDLGWEHMNLPYDRLVETADEIKHRLDNLTPATDPRGVLGMLRIAKWLKDEKKEKTNLIQLYRAFIREHKFGAAAAILLNEPVPEREFNWPWIQHPYDRFIQAVQNFVDSDPVGYSGGDLSVLGAGLQGENLVEEAIEAFPDLWTRARPAILEEAERLKGEPEPASQADLVLPLWGSVLTVLFVVFLFETFGKAYQRARRTTNTRIFVVYLVPALELVALPGLMIVLATMMSPVLGLLLSSFLFAVAHDVDRLSIWLYAKVRGRAPPESLLSIADRIVTRFRGSLEITALAYLPFDLFYSQSFTFSSLFSLIHWPLLLSSALLAYGRHALWNRTVGKEYRLMADTPSSEEPSQTLFDSFDDLIEYVVNPENEVGIDLASYATNHGKHGVYHALQALDEKGFQIRPPKSRPGTGIHSPTRTNIRKAHDILNHHLSNRGLFKRVGLRSEIFFSALEKIRANNDRYKELDGQFRLAKELVQEFSLDALAMGDLYNVFCSDQGRKALGQDLKWKSINFPYFRLVKTAREIKDRLDNPEPATDPRGVLGMLQVAKWLNDEKKEKTHLSHLYSAFGGDGKYQAAVKILLEEDVEEVDLGWEYMNLPYDRLVETADEIKHRLDNSTPETDPRGVLGMLRLAKWLNDEKKEKTNLGQLYSAFGGEGKYQSAVKILLGKDVKEDNLGWEMIVLPYDRLVETADEIKRRLDNSTPETDPRGVLGMLRIAKWLNDEKKEKTSLGQLYSAFGGEGKYRAVVKILLRKDVEEVDLGWEYISLPYDRLVETADEIKRRLDNPEPATDPRGVLGMLRIAKWLNDEKKEKTNLGQLYSAFGGEGKYQSAVKILLGKDVKEDNLGWEIITLPYDRLVETADEIKRRLENLTPETDPRGVLGMLRIAKWLKDEKKEKTHLSHLCSAFGGDGKYQSAVKILLGKDVKEVDLGWEYINLPYDRLVETADEIKRRLENLTPETDPRGVLGMFRIAKWLKDEKKEKTNLGQLYSAFGGEGKYQSVVKILLGKDVKEVDLGWEYMNLPYDRLVETADEIKRRLENLTPTTDPRGVLGMLRIAKWLKDEKKEKTNLGQLYSAFGGEGKYQSAVKILLGKDVKEVDLGWEYINLPYDRLVETADEIKRRLENLTPETDPRGVLGMLRIAKWLKDEKKEKTHLSHLHRAFIREHKFGAAAAILLNEPVPEREFNWPRIDHPHDRFIQAVQNFVGSRRVGYSDDELSVLGAGLQGENLVEEVIEAFPDLWTRARPAILEEAERLKGEPEPASSTRGPGIMLPPWASVLAILLLSTPATAYFLLLGVVTVVLVLALLVVARQALWRKRTSQPKLGLKRPVKLNLGKSTVPPEEANLPSSDRDDTKTQADVGIIPPKRANSDPFSDLILAPAATQPRLSTGFLSFRLQTTSS